MEVSINSINAQYVAYYLMRYNKWRRGVEGIEQPDPELLGEMLDRAIELLSEVK